jgi:hypothetical protein
MQTFDIEREQGWNGRRHIEKVLGTILGGDVSVACWEPGQISPNHCHPDATEIYFCYSGGGAMRTPTDTVEIVPGSFVVHPPRVSCTNTRTVAIARSCSECGTAPTCVIIRSPGVARPAGYNRRRIGHISRVGPGDHDVRDTRRASKCW